MFGRTLEVLREALYEPPSEAVWTQVVEAVSSAAEGDLVEVAVDYAASVMDAGWPDRLRCAPRLWWLGALAGREVAGWRLVRALEIEDTPGIDEALRAPWMGSIRALRLGSGELVAGRLGRLLGGAATGEVRHLEALHAPWIRGQTLDALDSSELWPALETLRFWGSPLSAGLLRSLCVGRWTRGGGSVGLQGLELGGATMDLAVLKALWEELSGVRRLSLASAGLDERYVPMMSGAGPLGLVELGLSGNALRGGLWKLAQAPWLSRLEALELSENGLSWRDLRGFVRSAEVPLLRRLALNGNFLEAAGAGELALAEGWDALEELSLVNTRLDDAGAARLSGAVWFGSLERLDVSENPLGEAGLAALRAALRPGAQLVFRSRRVDVLGPAY